MKRSFKYILTLLGFGAASCIRVEYGCPHVDYRISGQVVNEKGEPVQGIGVLPGWGSFTEEFDWNLEDLNFGPSADTTGVDGKFLIYSDDVTCPDKVVLYDTDGEKNGQYKTTIAPVTLTQTGKGDNHWYNGTYAADDVTLIIED